MDRSTLAVGTMSLLAASLFSVAASASDPTARECIGASEAGLDASRHDKLTAARVQYLACAAQQCPEDVRLECARRVEEINAAMPTVIFKAKDAAGADVVLTRVVVDGTPLESHLNGAPMTLDPGPHRMHFEAGNEPALDRVVVLRAGEQGRVEALVFGSPPPRPATEPPLKHDATRRTIGVAVAALGVVGLGFGAFFGARAFGLWGDSKAACRSPSDCTDHGLAISSHDQAMTAATISTVLTASGVGLLAVGGVVFFTAPLVGPKHDVGFVVGGAF